MWTLAWNTHAFVHQPLSIFDANIFYPQRNSLAFSENLIGSALFAAPVLWLTGNPVLAVNVVSLLSVVLCGLGAYVLGRRVGLSPAAAVLAGLIFAFSPPRFLRFSQIHLTVVQWIPFALASLHAYLDGGRRRDLLLAIDVHHPSGAVERSWRRVSGRRDRAHAGVSNRARRADRSRAAPARLRHRRRAAAGAERVVRDSVPDCAGRGGTSAVARKLGHARSKVSLRLPHAWTCFSVGSSRTRNINGVATAWLFPGFLPLGLTLVAILAGCAVIARRAPALWHVEWRRLARMVPYGFRLRACSWLPLWGVRSAPRDPTSRAGDGLAEQTFGNGQGRAERVHQRAAARALQLRHGFGRRLAPVHR